VPLAVGERLGPYEIVAPLGQGGMGEVYRARDTRLGRTVAIKVLPVHLTADERARERFEREARAISSLSHPHICALYDVGRHEETDYLVMEYLEGETLATRLVRGALPFDEALRSAIEIADALDRAHREGIVHRDLKPGNVMMTRSGVKLLDFGLAQWQPPPLSGASALQTEAGPLTAEGTIVGTLQYMAPEQLQGKPADSRTDIFAFGAVLYEMATGRKAFPGENQASIIAAILSSQPPAMRSAVPEVPPPLDRIVARCLAKDPDNRWQSARDVMLELRWITESGPAAGLPHPEPAPRKRDRIGWGAAGLVLGILVALVAGRAALRTRPANADRPITRLNIALDPPLTLSNWQRPNFALSPDGTRLVYGATVNGRSQLFLRPLEKLDSSPLPGTEDADGPFFSPNGQWVGFFAASKLKKISVAGGSPVVLAGVPPVTRGASWGSDDTIVLATSNASRLYRLPAAGGTLRPLTRLDVAGGEQTHRWPDILPGGKTALFTVGAGGSFDEARIAVVWLDGGKKKFLAERGTYPRYLPTGHIVFVRGNTLFAAPFDLDRLDVTGPAVPIFDAIRTEAIGAAHFSFARTGALVALRGPAAASRESELVWVDRSGMVQLIARGAFWAPRLSPDGSRVAVVVLGSSQDIWEYEATRGTLTRLTLEGGEQFDPVWTPDGSRILYSWERAGSENEGPGIFSEPSNGTGKAEFVSRGGEAQFPQSWSPDGKALAFSEFTGPTKFDLGILPAEGDRKPRVFLRTEYSEAEPAFSPDGHWIAYTSDESGRFEVYLRPYPGPGSKVLVSTEGGTEPAWASDGRELFYRNGAKMMAVSTRLSPAFTADTPRVLFEGPFLTDPDPEFRQYDVAPDGQRFLMIRHVSQAAPLQLDFIVEWFSDVLRRVPTRR
jgi:serine/threonine protein kinase/Tol biopolymer transport system component